MAGCAQGELGKSGSKVLKQALEQEFIIMLIALLLNEVCFAVEVRVEEATHIPDYGLINHIHSNLLSLVDVIRIHLWWTPRILQLKYLFCFLPTHLPFTIFKTPLFIFKYFFFPLNFFIMSITIWFAFKIFHFAPGYQISLIVLKIWIHESSWRLPFSLVGICYWIFFWLIVTLTLFGPCYFLPELFIIISLIRTLIIIVFVLIRLLAILVCYYGFNCFPNIRNYLLNWP